MPKTLVLIKPDGVRKNIIGEIIARFERRGLKIAGLKMLRITEAQAQKHYAEHADKPFFGELVKFITSGPAAAMVVEGENAVKAVRGMMGATNPLDAVPGSIRGDYALNMSQNVVHGSDSEDSAKREIENFFTAAEIFVARGENNG